eukprot:PhM_4_TR7247/c0_g1_i2/m.42832/K11086/SNRPB, SMB; small nuclear ribonucleoprotein B and B'
MQDGRSKMFDYVNQKIRLVMGFDRQVTGTLLAFDRHMNIVIADAEETRVVYTKKVPRDETRSLGLVMLRGENVMSIALETKGSGGATTKKVSKRARDEAHGDDAAARGVAGTKTRAPPAGRGKPAV